MKLYKPLIIFDLETTGTSISHDKIVQIAAIKRMPDGHFEEKNLLLNPQMPIPPGATEVHGITDEMVQSAPTFKQVSKAMKEYFNGCDIGGYNSDVFDIPLLIMEFHRCGIEFPDWELNFIDGLKLERHINSHKLSETYKRYSGKDLDGAHDALNDTRATLSVISTQISILGQEKEFTVADADKLCQGENGRFDYAGKCYLKNNEVYWSFGKNKDKPILQDTNYLNWVLNSDFPIQTKKIIKEYLEIKKQQNEN